MGPITQEGKPVDAIDLEILHALAASGRTTFSDLAEKTGLSGPSTADRVRRLEERGAIRGYAALVDPASLGLDLTAFVAVTLDRPASRDGFLSAVRAHPAILECHHVAGDDDYLLKVRTAGTAGLERFVSDELKSVEGVARTRTIVVLSSPVEEPFVPGPVLP